MLSAQRAQRYAASVRFRCIGRVSFDNRHFRFCFALVTLFAACWMPALGHGLSALRDANTRSGSSGKSPLVCLSHPRCAHLLPPPCAHPPPPPLFPSAPSSTKHPSVRARRLLTACPSSTQAQPPMPLLRLWSPASTFTLFSTTWWRCARAWRARSCCTTRSRLCCWSSAAPTAIARAAEKDGREGNLQIIWLALPKRL